MYFSIEWMQVARTFGLSFEGMMIEMRRVAADSLENRPVRDPRIRFEFQGSGFLDAWKRISLMCPTGKSNTSPERLVKPPSACRSRMHSFP